MQDLVWVWNIEETPDFAQQNAFMLVQVAGGPDVTAAVTCNCNATGAAACICARAGATVPMASQNTLIQQQGACGYGPLFANTSQGYNFVVRASDSDGKLANTIQRRVVKTDCRPNAELIGV